MRFFSLVDFQYEAMAVLLGLVAAILIFMAWGSYPRYHRPTSEGELKHLKGHEMDSGHSAEKNPIAPFLIFIYIGISLWTVAYMVYTGLYGTNF